MRHIGNRGTTNAAVQILLTGKKCKFNVSFILTEISRVSRLCFLLFCLNFKT